MKKTSFFLFLFLLNFAVFAQDTLVYDLVEKGAQPEKGLYEFYVLIRKNVTAQKEARRLGLCGSKIWVEGIVDEQGNYQLKSLKPECLDWESAKQALETTKWIPAENKGKKVKQRIVIPMYIKLG